MCDVSAAVHRLLSEIRAACAPAMCIDADIFRRDHCYTEEVTTTLGSYESTLRILFSGASGSLITSRAGTLLSLFDWEDFLKALGFVGADLSERDVRYAFAWSRMLVVDGRTEKNFLRETCLPFESFVEAIVRISVMKALPTDDEIATSVCTQAGEYMVKLAADDKARYWEMLRERASSWGEEQVQEPTARCVAKTIEIIVYLIKSSISEVDGSTFANKLTDTEMKRWLRTKRLHLSF